MARIKTFYDELGVDRNADGAAIKHAFKEIAKIYHPDKNPPDKQAWAHEQMSRLNFIVDTLLNPATRKEYDGLVKKYALWRGRAAGLTNRTRSKGNTPKFPSRS